MVSVTVNARKIQVGDTAVPLFGGEVHYWRLAPENWRGVLQRVREMGIMVVATYVCWDFHETAPGTYDFTGATDPRRNLLGFLDLLADKGFWVILRPGPYIYSEWSNNGVPDHAAQYHRLDPRFQQVAQHYMTAVVEAVRPHLATQGGRIIVWQSDNEIDPWPHLYTEQLGLGRDIGAFHGFLTERYGDVSSLNAAWCAAYAQISEARAVMEMNTNDARLMARYNDFRAFLQWYVSKVAAWGIETYRQLGVDVPILLNTYSGVATQHWSNLEKIADIVGPDIYPSREFTRRGGSKEHRTFIEAVRYTHSFSRLPYIPEFEAGIWHDWLDDVGYLPPNHYRLLCVSALMGGAAGWNWYMLVNRDNWYQSPINEWGRTRPELFRAFKQITALYHTVDPTTLTKHSLVAVTFDPLQRGTERPGQDLLHSFYLADVDYDFMDLSQPLADRHTVAFYAGGNWLPQASHDRLAAWVKDGGHLICVGDYPRLDEHHHAYNPLRIPDPDAIVSTAPFRSTWALLDGLHAPSAWVYDFASPPGEALTATRLPVDAIASEELVYQFNLEAGQSYTAGYSVEVGTGRVTVLGIAPTPPVILGLLAHLGTVLPCRSQTAGVTSALYERDGAYYVMVANAGQEAKTARIDLDPAFIGSGVWQAENLLDAGSAPLLSDHHLTVNIGPGDGIVVRLSRTASAG
jgi:hypothetical protein